MSKILIIDDNEYLRFTLSAVIEDYGYSAITAQNCREGIDCIMEGPPELIILDKKLPDCDGINLLKKIKELDEYRHIPVIMLTAYANETSEEQAIHLGAAAFLTKPFDNDEIMTLIKSALSKKIS
jgi:DNA-binding NtrC family response regulator